MAMNGCMDEQFHDEMPEKDGELDDVFDNIGDIDIANLSKNRNVFLDLEELDSCFDGEPLVPPLPPATATSALTSSSDDVGSGHTAEENQICDELDIPEDWFKTFLDDTGFNVDLPVIPENDYITKDDTLFRSTSPISVLEESNLNGSGESNLNGSGVGSGSRSSSSSNSITNDTDIVSLSPMSPPGPAIPSIPARTRSKRPRPANVTVTSSFMPAILEEFDNFSESCPPLMKKKKKYPPLASIDINEGGAVRKCMHCGIQKTPQWRAGPRGPKTLCNACGVRYKSGRLFPEYRPAASPTFVPSVHSNSHKKVVEMRIKACQKDTNAMPKAASPALKNCDLVAYIRRKD